MAKFNPKAWVQNPEKAWTDINEVLQGQLEILENTWYNFGQSPPLPAAIAETIAEISGILSRMVLLASRLPLADEKRLALLNRMHWLGAIAEKLLGNPGVAQQLAMKARTSGGVYITPAELWERENLLYTSMTS